MIQRLTDQLQEGDTLLHPFLPDETSAFISTCLCEKSSTGLVRAVEIPLANLKGQLVRNPCMTGHAPHHSVLSLRLLQL